MYTRFHKYNVSKLLVYSYHIVPSGPVVLEKDPETSATGMKLSWKRISKRFWNGERVTFVVSVSRNHKFQKFYTTKATNAIISGLRPSTTYNVTITGNTVFGPFLNATRTSIRTKESKF